MENDFSDAMDFTNVNIFSSEFRQMLNSLAGNSKKASVHTNTLKRRESPDGVVIELPDWVKQVERRGYTMRVLNEESTSIEIGDVVPIDQGHTLDPAPDLEQEHNYASFGLAANKSSWEEGDYFGVALEHSNAGNGYKSVLVQVSGVALAKCTIGASSDRFASISAGAFSSGASGDYRLVNHLPTSGFAFIDLCCFGEATFAEVTGVVWNDGTNQGEYTLGGGALQSDGTWVSDMTTLTTEATNLIEIPNDGSAIEGSSLDLDAPDTDYVVTGSKGLAIAIIDDIDVIQVQGNPTVRYWIVAGRYFFQYENYNKVALFLS